MTKTIEEKLEYKKINKPSLMLYKILMHLVIKKMAKKYNTSFEVPKEIKNTKGPFIVVFNHQSRNDYVFTSLCFKKPLNFVVGYNEFFRSKFKLIFNLAQTIPKRNFVPDSHTIRECLRIISKKGAICIAPEGMSSISGGNQPIALGTGKFLKLLKAPVFCISIKGAYLMAPKYCLTKDRIGKVFVKAEKLFSREDLLKFSPKEIENKLTIKLKQDDYDYNKKLQIKYTGKSFAKNIENFLFICPKCKSEFSIIGEEDNIICVKCGNGAKLDNAYNLVPLSPNCIFPETPKAWFDFQRRIIHNQIIQNKEYSLTEEVKLGVLPKYKYLKHDNTSNIEGKGIITINRNGFTYNGTLYKSFFSFHIETNKLPTYGMCTDMTRFYTFFNKEFYEFYPKSKSVAKWLIVTEELHRINGGAWQNFYDFEY